jgi:hypothetical protein
MFKRAPRAFVDCSDVAALKEAMNRIVASADERLSSWGNPFLQGLADIPTSWRVPPSSSKAVRRVWMWPRRGTHHRYRTTFKPAHRRTMFPPPSRYIQTLELKKRRHFSMRSKPYCLRRMRWKESSVSTSRSRWLSRALIPLGPGAGKGRCFRECLNSAILSLSYVADASVTN